MFTMYRFRHPDKYIVFQKSTQSIDDNIQKLIANAGYRQATLLQQKVIPLFEQGKDLVIETDVGEGRTGSYLLPLINQVSPEIRGIKAVILTATTQELRKISRQYKRFSTKLHVKPYLAELGWEDSVRKELRLLAKTPDIIAGTTQRVIDHLRRENLSLENVQYLIVIMPNDVDLTGFDKDVLFIHSKVSGRLQTVIYMTSPELPGDLYPILRKPQQLSKEDWCQATYAEDSDSTEENVKVSTKVSQERLDLAKEEVKHLLTVIKEEEDLDTLIEFQKIYKKNVPLHLRRYFVAYLLKEALTRGGKGSQSKHKTLFVSIGKNRKVYPRDLNQLLAETAGIPSSQIGTIKILDNYSFVDVPEHLADKAINALDATEFRGRKLTVNYARKREDKKG